MKTEHDRTRDESPLTPEELAEQTAEELPAREVMTTLPLELTGTPRITAEDADLDADDETA